MIRPYSPADDAAMLRSLKRLAQLEGDLQVLPGHMELSTLEHERRTNYYMRQALEMDENRL